jgi:hypothetical protein
MAGMSNSIYTSDKQYGGGTQADIGGKAHRVYLASIIVAATIAHVSGSLVKIFLKSIDMEHMQLL